MILGIICALVGGFMATQNTSSKVAWPLLVGGLCMFLYSIPLVILVNLACVALFLFMGGVLLHRNFG